MLGAMSLYIQHYSDLVFVFLLFYPARVLASGGGAEDNNRLLDTIFQGYKPATLPRLNDSRPVDVQVGMGVIAVVDLDTRSQVLNLRGYARIFWTDELLRWNPKDYGNITYVILSQHDVWKPDIILTNALQENTYLGNEETLVWLNYDGAVSWQPAFNSDFTCQVDVLKYPMDVNICVIKVGAWMHDNFHINLTILEPHVFLEYDVTNGQFDIDIVAATKRIAYYRGNGYDYIYFKLKLSRKPAYVILSLLLPMFVIGLLNIVSFLIPADYEGKVDLSLNILLATAVLITMVQDDLPDRSDRIASVAAYVISLFVLAFLGVLGNTIVLLVHRKELSERSEDHPTPATDTRTEDNNNGTDDMEALPFPRFRFENPRALPSAVSDVEMSSKREIMSLKHKSSTTPTQSKQACSASIMAVFSGSKAARLNFRFLVGNALCLLVCSVTVLTGILG